MYRVYYYSNYDLSLSHDLLMAEKRIENIENGALCKSMEDMIELWHIRRMLQDDNRLTNWTEEHFLKLKCATDSYDGVVARYFKSMEPDNVKEEYNKLVGMYRKSFWKIVTQFKCFDRIKPDVLHSIIIEDVGDLRYVLYSKNLVDRFKNVVKDVLLNRPYEAARIILDKFVTRKLGNQDDIIYLPNNLSVREREDIIVSYLESKEPNLNYVHLICEAKDVDGQFVLSPKTRLMAGRLGKKLGDEMMNNPRTSIISLKAEVSFTDDEAIDVLECSNDNGFISYKYNKVFIKKSSNRERMTYCAGVFGWFNKHFMLNLVNKNCEVEGLEMLLMDRGRDSYPDFRVFRYKNALALNQLNGYCNVLAQYGSSFENELKVFYERQLKDEFDYPALSIKLPRGDDDQLVKCRIIFPELDNVARQYNTYVNEDEIDAEYLALLKPMKMTEAKSLLINKYCELDENNEKINRIMYCLFASGTLLDRVSPFEDKNYGSFANLMENEKVHYDNYEAHKKTYVDFLIEEGLVEINEAGILLYIDNEAIKVLRSVWEYGACSYWHLGDGGRKAADAMIAKGWLLTDDHLLCKAERRYFSYYTDNAEFTNGFAYRNHYAHGSTPPVEDVNAHAMAYIVLLRLLYILILKIYDDLWLARRAFAIGCMMKSNYRIDNSN